MKDNGNFERISREFRENFKRISREFKTEFVFQRNTGKMKM